MRMQIPVEEQVGRWGNREQPGTRYRATKLLEIAMTYLCERITVDPERCGGRPCVRGMRVRVQDVVDLFAAGLTAAEILDEMPDLEDADLKACLSYVSRLVAHPVVAV